MNIKHIIILSGLILGMKVSHAQLLDCAAIVSEKQKQLENTFQDSIHDLIKLHRTFHLNFHIVKNEAGETEMEVSSIDPAVALLNDAFTTIEVEFKTSKILSVDNFSYNTIYYNNTDNELVDVSFVPNTINIYLVDKLYDNEGRITCSYTFLPAEDKDLIFIQKDCFDGRRLIHLVGHIFNLYHTHEESFGLELVDGTNCGISGDLCCDTEAMPDITGMVNDDCELVGEMKDENEQYYYPSTQNYMSFAPAECRCYFSEQQYIRMINAMVKLQTDLW